MLLGWVLACMQRDVQKMERDLVDWTCGNSFRAVHSHNCSKAVSEADNQRLSDIEDELVHKFCADSCTGHACCYMLLSISCMQAWQLLMAVFSVSTALQTA